MLCVLRKISNAEQNIGNFPKSVFRLLILLTEVCRLSVFWRRKLSVCKRIKPTNRSCPSMPIIILMCAWPSYRKLGENPPSAHVGSNLDGLTSDPGLSADTRPHLGPELLTWNHSQWEPNVWAHQGIGQEYWEAAWFRHQWADCQNRGLVKKRCAIHLESHHFGGDIASCSPVPASGTRAITSILGRPAAAVAGWQPGGCFYAANLTPRLFLEQINYFS